MSFVSSFFFCISNIKTFSAPISIPNAPQTNGIGSQKSLSPKASSFEPENFPPNSRLFVLCDKNATEEDLIRHFTEYGDIEYCKLIKDKANKQSKGYCYVKFKKASSAAKALEQAEGSRIGNLDFPIKVQIAAAKGKKNAAPVLFSSEPEDTPPRSRLFVVCPKELTEKELHSEFSQFGEFDYCKVIVDKTTGISKGFAYVKFKKASSAAVALENVNETGNISGRNVKVLVADPKSKGKVDSQAHGESLSYSASGSPPSPFYYPMPYPFLHTQVSISVECDPSLSQSDISRLFSAYEGFEYCDFIVMTVPSGEMKGISQVYFSDYQRASIAMSNVQDYEFMGSPIQCTLNEHPVYPVIPGLPNSPPAGSFAPFMVSLFCTIC